MRCWPSPLLGLLVVGGRYGLLENRIATLGEEVTTFQAEVDELEPIIREVEEFKAKKAELERKVLVINRLKANQSGPVQIMDYMSRALPELLWLNRMQVGAQIHHDQRRGVQHQRGGQLHGEPRPVPRVSRTGAAGHVAEGRRLHLHPELQLRLPAPRARGARGGGLGVIRCKRV